MTIVEDTAGSTEVDMCTQVDSWNSNLKDMAGEFLASREREVKEPVGGYVYFLGAEEHGVVKIGRTKNLSERVHTLRIQLPFDTELLHSIECADELEVETSYHRKYADKRKKGSEWFRLTAEDLKEIRSVNYVGKKRRPNSIYQAPPSKLNVDE